MSPREVCLHYLVVPDGPDQPMEIEHPETCKQHGRLVSVRDDIDQSIVCPFEEQQWRTGLEVAFGRVDEDVPLFSQPAERVAPGRYPIECTTEGLRLAAAVRGGAA